SGDGPEETLAAVARAAVPAVADWCTVELTDPDGGRRTVAVVAADPDTQRRLEEFVHRFPPTPDDDRGVALAAGRPVLLERVDRALLEARAPGPDALALLLELDPRSAMLVPIVVGDRAEGLVSFVRSGSGLRYGPEDLAMAAEFARRAGATIERARLLEETRALAAELERRVEERTRELREINAELDAFAYSVSHDLRAPLRAMEGFARALEEDYADRLDEAGRDYVRRVVRAAQRMDVLIQDLLAYSRLARADLPLQAVELDAAAAEALDRVAADVAARGAEVDVAVGMPAVVAHPATLVQVLSNLLSNAVKFVAPGVVPRVRVRAERRGEAVRVEVLDNGIGIDPAHRERIFRVLERLHGADAYPGTGIGLAIVRRAVERMGGRVDVESQPGRGSAFWFELPGADP
ncbi:MAG TPA: ATP-binding protein, partial [Actinomycetota bacterium]|nr:ATP-binding protein [Actinomycetota bacterium]